MASTEELILNCVVYYVDPESHYDLANKYKGGKENRRIKLSGKELKRFFLFSTLKLY